MIVMLKFSCKDIIEKEKFFDSQIARIGFIGKRKCRRHHLQKMEESYRRKLLDELDDTVFNSERNNSEEIKANATKRGPDGWGKLELKEG